MGGRAKYRVEEFELVKPEQRSFLSEDGAWSVIADPVTGGYVARPISSPARAFAEQHGFGARFRAPYREVRFMLEHYYEGEFHLRSATTRRSTDGRWALLKTAEDGAWRVEQVTASQWLARRWDVEPITKIFATRREALVALEAFEADSTRRAWMTRPLRRLIPRR